MNAFSQMMHRHPLFSDTLISPSAKNLWKKLIVQAKAKEFKKGQNDRYTFL